MSVRPLIPSETRASAEDAGAACSAQDCPPPSFDDDPEALRALESVRQRLFGGPSEATEARTVGRYTLGRLIGAGAMSLVYAGLDPELGRTVAIKQLRPSRADQLGGARRQRREATTLGRLCHPNIVTVYDVVTVGDEVFIAMEYVDGVPLSKWLTERPRPWSQIVRVFIEAGRGLQAAHDAGVIHRDFKPDNVLIDGDGRARVVDFGLARPIPDDTLQSGISSLGLSVPGMRVGTPLYMAPEQHRGAEVDARCDQFAFCVSLYAALLGRHPFAGHNVRELGLAKLEQRMARGDLPRGLPRRIVRAIRRGMAPDPGDRWPDMRSLLARLRPSRPAWVWWAAATVPLVAAVGFAGWSIDRCEVDAPRWDDDVRQATRSGLTGLDLSRSTDAWDRVERGLSEYQGRWVTARGQLCDGRASAARARGLRCLRGAAHRFDALTELFGDADVAILDRSVAAVANLPSLEECRRDAAHPPAGRGTVDPAEPHDPGAADEAVRLERMLARAEALAFALRNDDVLDMATAVREGADAIGYDALGAQAAVSMGLALLERGHTEAAIEQLREAYFAAQAIDQQATSIEAASYLVYATGFVQANPDEGRRWFRNALTAVERNGRPTPGSLYSNLASVAFRAGQYDEAVRNYEEALSRLDTVEDRLQIALVRHNLGGVYDVQGRYDEAIACHLKALDLRRAELGPSHPDVARSLSALAVARTRSGDDEGAIVLHEQAIEVLEQTLGPSHPTTARAYTALALAMPDDPKRRLELNARAAAVFEKAYGPRHPDVAAALINQAVARRHLGEPERALALARRVVEILVQLDPHHPTAPFALAEAAKAELALGDRIRARDDAHRALVVLDAREAPPWRRAGTQFLLARIVADEDRDTALDLARRARDALADRPSDAEMVAEIDAWLEDHATSEST